MNLNDRWVEANLDTLGNDKWLKRNEDKIRDMLPEKWTPIYDIGPLSIGFKLKLLGVSWTTDAEFGLTMAFLYHKKIMLLEDNLVVRNPNKVFA